MFSVCCLTREEVAHLGSLMHRLKAQTPAPARAILARALEAALAKGEEK